MSTQHAPVAIYPDLQGKTIFVTGASRGIGKSIALALATQKAHIVFNYRGEASKAQLLQDELLAAGASQVSPLAFDLTDTVAMQKAIETFMAQGHTLKGLVNNAGKSKDQLCLRVKAEDIDDLFAVNLKASMLLTNTLAKYLMKAQGASVVNMSSVVGLMGNVAQTVYATTKAGLLGYTKSLAKELASRQVRVNAICPGFIATDMTEALGEKAKEEYAKNIPLGRFGSPEDVAQLAVFLLSDSSKYMTGEVIKIDGGLYI
jgi:3-oxoacyl-[acyl-carrier protein] reductase